MLLIAAIASGTLSDAVARAQNLAELRSTTRHCPVTGKKTFVSALSAALSSEEMAQRMSGIDVWRTGAKAIALIYFDAKGENRFGVISKFGSEEVMRHDHPAHAFSVHVAFRLPFDVLARALMADGKVVKK